jgi:biotin carboxylase
VELADRLAVRVGTRNNGEELTLARRNKYVMGETVRAAGVRAVRQQRATEWSTVKAFLDEWQPNPFLAVVKPIQSAGSDDVFKCSSEAEVKEAFDKINGAINGLGLVNEGVLVQEFLAGKEYVVDSVSLDGVHKVTAIWEYDKRSVNNANFVYFGMKLLPGSDAVTKQLVAYSDSVLDALNIINGPGHMEIMMCPDGPCLVEVGSRCHGGEGSWRVVADECVGYNQIHVTLDAYLNPSAFAALPYAPTKLNKAGCEVFLVSRQSGVVRGLPSKDIIAALPSFRTQDWQLSAGSFARKTIDCFTRPGAVQLVHEDPAQLARDVEAIRELETKRQLIDFEVICAEPPEKGVVVVVDPFTSGALVAAGVLQLNYRLVLVFSDTETTTAVGGMQHSAAAFGAPAESTAAIQHNQRLPEAEAVAATVAELRALGAPIVAVLPGAETGVLLADQLADTLGTRSNPLELSVARRNKYVMGETVRAAGVRAVRQQRATEWAAVKAFLDEWQPNPFLAVVKPIQSAGSDDVFKCSSEAEVKEAFDKINGAINMLGVANEGVLVQEFLAGKEFVVDSVSRDGVHKVTAIWEYDKRSVNDANFVYFGMKLLSASDAVAQQLVAYSDSVLDALNIINGPGHMEIMMCPDGPCLVEVGSRCHGGEGSWRVVADECVGYNQITASIDAFLNPSAFAALPAAPSNLSKSGCEVFLVAQRNGVVKALPGLDTIRALPSFRSLGLAIQPGMTQKRTVDCFTRPGSVQLVNADAKQLEIDVAAIRQLEIDGLFEFS